VKPPFPRPGLEPFCMHSRNRDRRQGRRVNPSKEIDEATALPRFRGEWSCFARRQGMLASAPSRSAWHKGSGLPWSAVPVEKPTWRHRRSGPAGGAGGARAGASATRLVFSFRSRGLPQRGWLTMRLPASADRRNGSGILDKHLPEPGPAEDMFERRRLSGRTRSKVPCCYEVQGVGRS
jgi:hypothetical protein